MKGDLMRESNTRELNRLRSPNDIRRTTKRRFAKGRWVDCRRSYQMSEVEPVEHRGRAEKQKEAEKSWVEIAEC